MLRPRISSVSQAQRERLFHIDSRLYFLSAVNRSDLVSRFGIEEAVATRDFSLYKELAPGNLLSMTLQQKPIFNGKASGYSSGTKRNLDIE